MPPHSSHGRLRTSFLACFFLHKISPQTLTTVLLLGRRFTNSRYYGPSNQGWLYDTNPKSALLRKNTSLKVTIHLVYIWCLLSAMGNLMIPVFLPLTIEDTHPKFGRDALSFFLWTHPRRNIFSLVVKSGTSLTNQNSFGRVNNSTPPPKSLQDKLVRKFQ